MALELDRRSFFRLGLAAGAATIAPRWAMAQISQAAAVDRLGQMRAAGASTPIKTTKLYDNVFLLQGAGGNMAVQIGPEGKILIDSSFATAVPHIREAMNALSNDPAFAIINTHWHIDHTDGNDGMHAAGFTVYAHEKTRARLSQPAEMKLFGMSLPASPAGALPTITFDKSLRVWHNGDSLELAHFDPAHTDTDIYIHFHNADVLHLGDIWFNGMYPFIDEGTGGSIGGMISASKLALSLAGDKTKIIPGHGPLGTRAELQKSCDMLSTVRDKVAALKTSGASEKEVLAKKPTADLDSTWAKGSFSPDMFVGIVYRTL
jgi:glyoxylase-like metal-dependent hydrolase (beta-lactamase superfamily II)